MASNNLLGGDSVQDSESHRFIHRFIPSYVVRSSRIRWNNHKPRVLLPRASEVERRKKHGTPATSVAGVYSFLGPCNSRAQRVAGSAPDNVNLLDRSASGYLFPFAQLNRRTRSASPTRPRLRASRQ